MAPDIRANGVHVKRGPKSAEERAKENTLERIRKSVIQ